MAEVELKQAVILAGGLGERLKPFTNYFPKPMMPINGRPFLEHQIEILKENNIKEIVLCLGYLYDKIIDYFGDGSKFGIDIQYSVGDVFFETGKRIKHARKLLDENFLLMYCDNYWPMNLKSMFEFYKISKAEAMVTVYNNKDCGGEYGKENNLEISNQGYVLKYDPSRMSPRLNAIDIGFFILNKKVVELIPNTNCSFQKEVLPILINKKQLVAYRTDHPYYPITNEETVRNAEEFFKPKKIVFLDRDGVINKKAREHDYVRKWDDFEFLPGTFESLKLLKDNGYKIYVMTNQRGIARGMMTHQDLENIHANMKKELFNKGVELDGIYFCPHEIEDNCECRKPKIGMFLKASREHFLDLRKAIFIGDSETDILAGQSAGIKTFFVDDKNNLLSIAREIVARN